MDDNITQNFGFAAVMELSILYEQRVLDCQRRANVFPVDQVMFLFVHCAWFFSRSQVQNCDFSGIIWTFCNVLFWISVIVGLLSLHNVSCLPSCFMVWIIKWLVFFLLNVRFLLFMCVWHAQNAGSFQHCWRKKIFYIFNVGIEWSSMAT